MAVSATVSALLVRRFILVPVFDVNLPLVSFAIVVGATTWVSGKWFGVFATLLAASATIYLGIDDSGFKILPLIFHRRLLLVVAIGILISWLVDFRKSARRRMEDRQKQLEVEIAERRKADASERQRREQLTAEICRREQAESALREREERIRLAVEAADIGTWDYNPLTAEAIASARCKAAFGFSPEVKPSLADFIERIHPEDRESMQQAMQSALDPTGNGTYDLDYRTVCPDGTTRWLIAKGHAFFDGEMSNRRAVRFIGTVLEVTERKQAEAAMRESEAKRNEAMETLEEEQEMLRHTIEFQDQERELIASEIHDGLVQYATGALMQLESVQPHVAANELAERIDSIIGILRRTVAEGRRLMNGIRPPVLDDWGVVAAVEQLIDEEDRAHVHVQFIKDDALGRMPPRTEETLYRITQEALTNIRKHSQSKKVRIELGRQGDRVHLEIRDWGVGFTPTNGSAKGHGLRGMAQRARIAGGECKIDSTVGKGTQVVVELPFVERD